MRKPAILHYGDTLPPATEFEDGDLFYLRPAGELYIRTGGAWSLSASSSMITSVQNDGTGVELVSDTGTSNKAKIRSLATAGNGITMSVSTGGGEVELNFDKVAAGWGAANGFATLDSNALLKEFPQVDNIAALRSATGIGSTTIYVRGYYTDGDGGEGIFYYDSTDTTTADDGGMTIVDADGKRWKRVGVQRVSVKLFGARGDAIELSDVSTTSGSTTVTSASASFTSSDVGKFFVIEGAGDSGGYQVPLVAAIASVIDSSTVTLDTAASYSTTNSRGVYGSDDGPSIRSAFSYVTNGMVVYIPAGIYMIVSTTSGAGGSAGVYIDGKSVTVIGDGNKSIIDMTAITSPGFYLDSCNNMAFSQLALSGMHGIDRASGYAQYNSAIYIINSSYTKVHNVRINGFNGSAVRVNTSTQTIVDACTFVDVENQEAGSEYGVISISGGDSYTTVNSCIFKNSTSAASGVSISNANYCTITDNDITLAGSGSMGVYVLNGSSYNVISNNRIVNPGAEGVVIISGNTSGVTHNLVSSNIIVDPGSRGISIQRTASTSGNVENNTIANNIVVVKSTSSVAPDYGIVVDSCSKNSVANNIVDGVATTGIAVISPSDSSYDNKIAGNVVRGASGTPGIGIKASGYRVSIVNNVVENSVEGIRFNYFYDGSIRGNFIYNVTTGMNQYVGGTSANTVVAENVVNTATTAFVNIFNDTGLVRWKNRVSGSSYSGTVALSSGSATVTATGLPDSAGRINIVAVSPSGTPGALFVSAISGTSITISSTSSSDTSTVAWEIID